VNKFRVNIICYPGMRSGNVFCQFPVSRNAGSKQFEVASTSPVVIVVTESNFNSAIFCKCKKIRQKQWIIGSR